MGQQQQQQQNMDLACSSYHLVWDNDEHNSINLHDTYWCSCLSVFEKEGEKVCVCVCVCVCVTERESKRKCVCSRDVIKSPEK